MFCDAEENCNDLIFLIFTWFTDIFYTLLIWKTWIRTSFLAQSAESLMFVELIKLNNIAYTCSPGHEYTWHLFLLTPMFHLQAYEHHNRCSSKPCRICWLAESLALDSRCAVSASPLIHREFAYFQIISAFVGNLDGIRIAQFQWVISA